jgi:uncharacterized protein
LTDVIDNQNILRSYLVSVPGGLCYDWHMRKVIISGGSDGLGKALARALVKKGNKILILAPNEAKVGRVAQEIGCLYKVCDISKWENVKNAVAAADSELNGVDVLINNAGIARGGKLEDMSPEDIQNIFDVNVVGTLFLTKAVVPIMKRAGDGYIININSQGGLYTKPERALYSGSKWALTGITKVLQAELAPSGIKVTGLYPGAMEQTMVKQGQRNPRQNSLAYQDMVDAVEFVLNRSNGIVVPELGIKNLSN